MTRYQVLRLMTMCLVNGRSIKVMIDDHMLSYEWGGNRPYGIWHDETDGSIAAIIHEEDRSELDQMSEWAKGRVEY